MAIYSSAKLSLVSFNIFTITMLNLDVDGHNYAPIVNNDSDHEILDS
jgi:hypothetical protein